MRRKLGAVLVLVACLSANSALAQSFNRHAQRDSIRELVRDSFRQGLQAGPLGDHHPWQLLRLYLPTALIGALMLSGAQTLALRRRSFEAQRLRDEAERLRRALVATGAPPPLDQVLAVRVRNGRRLVKASDIDVVRAADDYCELVLSRGDRLLHAATLEALARQLPGSFRRIHRSVIVNIEKIEALRRRPSGGYEVVTRTGEVLPVGRSYLAAARRELT
jgi:hypothetical protein